MAGNLWMYSNQLDDEDLMFVQHDFITLNMGAQYYGLGMKSFTKMVREAGAAYKIGTKMVRINRLVFEDYLRKTRLRDVND